MPATKRALRLSAVEIQPEEIMHVLFVEHDTDYRQRIIRDLQGLGCRVDAVSVPAEAVEKLALGKYQMIIVDIKFPHPAISGDQFLKLNHSLMQGAQLVALTGARHSIKIDDEFDSLKVVIIDKGEEDIQLQEVSQDVYERAKEDVLKRSKGPKAGFPTGDAVEEYPLALGYLQEELLKELEQIADKESETVFYKGKNFSISHLIDQVRQKTDIGVELTRMMLNLIRWREEHGQKPHGLVQESRQES